MKRFLTCFAFVLCWMLCILAVFNPVKAQAAEVVANGSCGTDLSWSLDSDGILTISGTGSLGSFYDPAQLPWYEVRDSIKEARISEGVTFIAGNPFAGCSNLEKIVVAPENQRYSNDAAGLLYNKDKSVLLAAPGKFSGHYTVADTVVNVQAYAFYGCAGLTGITFHEDMFFLGESVFQNCTGLTFMELPETVTYVSYSLFQGCTGLKTVVVKANMEELPLNFFRDCTALTSVTLPESITKLGSNAFQGCASLISLKLPKNLQIIDSAVFKDCAALTSMEIPQSVTTIGSYSFQGCTKLKSINLPDNLAELGNEVFHNCTSLTSIRIPGSIGIVTYGCFYNCTALSSVTIGEGITAIHPQAFYNCAALTGISFPSSVTIVDYNAFTNCSKLAEVTFNNQLKTISSGAFYNCSALTQVVIPDSVSIICDSSFANCTSLASVTIGNGVTHVESMAFKDCSLTSLTLGDHITHIGAAAFDCDTLKNVVLPDSLVTISRSSFNVIEMDCYTTYDTGVYLGTASNPYHVLVDIINPSVTSLVCHPDTKVIASYTFYNSSISDLVLSDNLISIGADAFLNAKYLLYYFDNNGYYLGSETNPFLALIVPEAEFSNPFVVNSNTKLIADGAFAGNEDLTQIVFSSKMTRIGDHTFRECFYLTDLTFHSGITEIGDGAFAYCTGLKSLTVPATLKRIGMGAFSGNNDLAVLDVESVEAWLKIDMLSTDSTPLSPYVSRQLCEKGVPVTNLVIPEGITEIPYKAFYGCTNIKTVTISDSVTNIGSYAFADCAGITTLSIGKGVKQVESYAFYECNALTSLTIPGNVKRICTYAFFSCDSLTKLVIEPGVQMIDDTAFPYCNNLESIMIGSGVTRIGKEAFIRATALKTLSLPASLKQIDYCAFSYCENLTDIYLEDLAAYMNITFGEYASVFDVNDLPKTLYVQGAAVSKLVIPSGITKISDSLFAHCSSITSVTVPDSVKEIEASAFYGCSNLKQIDLGNGVRSIGDHAFYECTSLQSIVLPKGISVIDEYAFFKCSGLQSVTIPTSVTLVDYMAFSSCNRLSHVYYAGSQEDWNKISIDSGNFDLKMAEFHFGQAGSPALTGVTRIAGSDRYHTAFLAADQLKNQLGISKFDTIVVAAGTDFADALSGSYLAAVKNAPMLLVRNNTNTMKQVKEYIQANLAPGGTVYLLGGVNAVPKAMESGLNGFTVKRLGGATRYDTNLLILKEAGVGNKDILICTGKGFADSLSASAAKLPILLVKDSLTAAQKEFLGTVSGNKYIIGGKAAVSERIENAVMAYGQVKRLGGNTRYETSVLVAKEFFANPNAIVVAYAQNFPDGLSGGGLAAGMDAPLILVASGKEQASAAYAKEFGIRNGFVLGGSGLVSDKSVRSIFSLSANDPIQLIK